MYDQTKQTIAKSFIGIVVSVLLFFSSGAQVPILDSAADTYFKDSITKAGVSYGVCRVINATVSVIQESNIQLEPAGIGLSLAVGQIADPINDMVERLSDVLVMSITSLGVQELVYEIGMTIVPHILAVLLFLLSVLVWFKNTRVARCQRILVRVVIIAAIARFCLPLSSAANTYLQETFFEDKIIEATDQLSASTAEIDKLEDVTVPKFDGFIGTIGNSTSYIKEKSLDFKNTIQVILENRGTIIENLLRLTFLYLGIFVIQVIVLPLLIFWLLMRLVNALFVSTAFPSAETLQLAQ